MKRIVITRRRVLLSLAVVLALSLGMTFGMTSSYFTCKAGPVQNSVKMGLVNIGVFESNSDGVTSAPDSETTSGSFTFDATNTAIKKVWIKNIQTDNDSAPVYVRVRLVPIWRYDASTPGGDNTVGTGDSVTGVTFQLHNSSNWIAQTDTASKETYYYYKIPLLADKTTDQLLDSVTVSGGIPTGKHLEVQVLADAIQAKGGAASQIPGWADVASSLQQ